MEMSTLPILLSDVLNELYRPPYLFNQNFGYRLIDDDLPRLMSVPLHSGYLRQWRHLSTGDSGVSSFELDKSYFKVCLDVQQFKPEEIAVKVVDDYLVVEAKHEEREDKHGFVSRQFTRRYKIPSDTDFDGLKSTLSTDGVLTLIAPKKEVQHVEERNIPIIQTNEPALKSENGVGDGGDKI